MKYPVWFLRLLFASWMIPAGLEHFIPIFPQPMGSQPLSQEMIVALLDSHLFDLVKFVELIAGLGLLFGYFTPLSLIVCLPVSFNVFYWDAPLEGWDSIAARFGYATLLVNSLLILAYHKSYESMLTMKAMVPDERKQLAQVCRILLGGAILVFSANILFVSAAPAGDTPLAAQLMAALVNSRLLYVALILQFIAGALIMAGRFVPLALCIQMPLTTCALFWALILNQEPLLAVVTLAIFAVNALLMLIYLPFYKRVLEQSALAFPEEPGNGLNYDSLFINPNGQTSRADYIPALIVVVLTLLFYNYMVGGGGRNAQFCMLTLMYPLFVLITRRIRDMGQEPKLVFIPMTLVLLFFDVLLGYFSMGEVVDGAIGWLALVVTIGFMVWGSVGADKNAQPATS